MKDMLVVIGHRILLYRARFKSTNVAYLSVSGGERERERNWRQLVGSSSLVGVSFDLMSCNALTLVFSSIILLTILSFHRRKNYHHATIRNQ